MPPPKRKMTPPPIDRPLSKAYLRQFSGWSNEWAPGVSDPTSLRIMENVSIDRDGSARVRPGLRSLLRAADYSANLGDYGNIIGTHEVFFQSSGEKAYLFAYKTATEVQFAAMVPLGASHLQPVTLASLGFTTVGTVTFTLATTYVKFLQIDNKIFALSNAGEELQYFEVGSTKLAKNLQRITRPHGGNADKPQIRFPEKAWIDANPDGDYAAIPSSVATLTPNTLLSSDDLQNRYFYGYFYTLYNELGETAPSKVQQVRASRPWVGWRFETPNAASEPSGTETTNPFLAADQLVAILPSDVWLEGWSGGALGWNLYMFTWSDQDPVPSTAMKIGTKLIDGTLQSRYIQHTPARDILQENVPVPGGLRQNYTVPPKASQGLVAADRMVLVNDITDPAKIRWTSREQGSYTDFSPNKGGGFKTLTSGNLYLTACVKLWQNPSSADTLTILCDGVDGYSTGYYMAPATLSSQSEQVQVMGFEETTATPGTTSPYGCEVVNNALIHPLDDMLMKSTASNYNINHKSLTDLISRSWSRLRNKHRIVSSVLDGRIYYIVDNPDGEEVLPGNFGNEIWMIDTIAKTPLWNRWLVQGRSLRKVEVGGRVYMGLVNEQGLHYFDPDYAYDDRHVGVTVTPTPIAWALESNTQGANRAHDAWARLQQVSPMFTDFEGVVEYGIRGRDLNGKDIEVKKIFRQDTPLDPDATPLNVENQLLVRRDLKEWFFFARSVPGNVCHGGISSVQYRYTPSTVNSEYENGSVETFEYGLSILPPAP